MFAFVLPGPISHTLADQTGHHQFGGVKLPLVTLYDPVLSILFNIRRTTRLLAVLLVFSVLVLAAPFARLHTLNVPNAPKPLRVLFIGNSLTYANDLPSVVQALAKTAGKRRFSYKTIAFPNFSLEDHWNKQDARKAIAAGEWDFVVLQQGPSASKEGRALLLEYSRRFAEEIRRAGARPALYAVWPPASRLQDFKGVSESYRHAAEAVDGLLFPVGDAWLGAWTVNPEIGLYSADGFHPSAAGTYLAGLVIYQRLYNEPPMGLPSKLRLSSGGRIEIPADQALMLQHAAEEANKLIGRR